MTEEKIYCCRRQLLIRKRILLMFLKEEIETIAGNIED